MSSETAGRRRRELDVSRYWNDGMLPGELRLVDGRRIQIVYRGIWSNSDGPDFQNAMISMDGSLRTGPVEIHLRSSDWRRHGHDTDPAYNDVVLHVVLEDDAGDAVRTKDGRSIPTLELGSVIDPAGTRAGAHDEAILAVLGTRTCLPTLAARQPLLIREALRAKGWSRLAEKQLRCAQSLQRLTAPEVLYRGLLDALGYSANRGPMAQVGELLPLQLLERPGSVRERGRAMALLLGVGGFMPLSPQVVEMCGIEGDEALLEQQFQEISAAYSLRPIAITGWTLNRVRPANHPAPRLASLARLIEGASRDGLFGTFISLPLADGRYWDDWLSGVEPSIGRARRRQILTNVFAPFIAAYAELTRDEALAEQTAELWERLPGSVSDRIARAARKQIVGSVRFPVKLALEEQGLHEIHRTGCSRLNCFDCPIAELAMQHESLNAYAID